MTDQLETNKANAMAFYDLMFNQCNPEEAIAKYVGSQYIHHKACNYNWLRRSDKGLINNVCN